MTETRPDISVVIVSWNVRDLLIGCLKALASSDVQGALKLQVIVVDNASSDGSAEAAREFPGVTVIESPHNLGYGRANNIGLEAAAGDYLLVLNPDTEPLSGSLQALVNFIEVEEEAGILSPRLLNPDGTIQEAAFRYPTLVMAALDLFPLPQFIPGRVRAWLYRSRLNGRYPRESEDTGPYKIDHPLGACMMLRRQAYEQAGGFDPSIHMYAEEIDLALRYRGAGWECWQVPEAHVIHFGGRSTRQAPDRMFVELWRSRLYLYSKHYSGTRRRLLGFMLVTAQAAASLGALISLLKGKIDRGQARRTWKRAGALIKLALG